MDLKEWLDQLNRLKSAEAQYALIRNAHHVRELCLCDSEMFTIFVPLMQVTSSTISSTSFIVSSPSTADDLLPILCTHLEALYVQLSELPAKREIRYDPIRMRFVRSAKMGPWRLLSPEHQLSMVALVQQNPALTSL